MVLISLKSNNNDGFLYETTTSTKVDDLINALVEIHNARVLSCLIADAVKGLAMHGVMKRPEGYAGTDDDEEEEMITKESKGPNYTEDSSGMRTGNAPDAQMANSLHQEVQALEKYIDKNQVQNKVALTLNCIEEKINNVRDAVSNAFPMGLPKWEMAKIALDYIDDNDESKANKLNEVLGGSLIINANETSLWSCNKEFPRGKLVSDRLGSCNEKTKVIAKLMSKGAGAPAREPIVSEKEREAMAAYYFKRQEEMKRLALADEDDYLNSQWADPKGMKRNLQGLNDVKAPGSLRF